MNQPKQVFIAHFFMPNCSLFRFGSFIGLALTFSGCQHPSDAPEQTAPNPAVYRVPDTAQIPTDSFGVLVRYGRELMTNTAFYLGPQGVVGRFTGNKMSCSQCHQQAGTKPFSFSLMLSHERYPQYRAREGAVLTLADRVNNCIERPLIGRSIPLNSREMVGFLSYLKWINSTLTESDKHAGGHESLPLAFPDRAGDPERGRVLYEAKCQRCHAANGAGLLTSDTSSYTYPPLWGPLAYEQGSSMHRVLKQAAWLKANMPYDTARYDRPVLSDTDAIDLASFINDDRIHARPHSSNFDYRQISEKPIDYAIGPFIDSFPAWQHQFGPWKPIIEDRKKRGLKLR